MTISIENPNEAMQRAQSVAQSGNLAAAAEICRAVLTRHPANFYALFMLGTIEGEFKRFAEADALLARAIKLQPRSAEALTSHGNILIERKNHAEAITTLTRAIGIQPRNVNALIYRGLALAESGQPKEALLDFDRVLKIEPQSIFALHNRANALMALERPGEARPVVENLLRLAPNYVPALTNFALILKSESKHLEALAVLERALPLAAGDPAQFPDLLNARGHILLALKRNDEALAAYDRAIALNPQREDFQISRGNLLAALDRHEAALAAYNRAATLNPKSAAAHLNRGNMLMELNRLNDALAAAEQALTAKPDYVAALVLRGNILLHLGRPEEALSAHEKAVATDPDHAEAHYHRGSAFLLLGRFKEGLSDFEHRWGVADRASDRPVLEAQEWRGQPLAGKSMVVYSEQGLGDTIQFARFLTPLRNLGAALTFLCHPRLLRLFRPLADDIELLASTDSRRRFDYQCALMSLPHRFGTELATVPAACPYLFPEDARVRQWRDRIGPKDYRVGISWQGNPAGKIDKGRSVPLAEFAALAQIPGLRLISLQTQHGLEQLAAAPAELAIETLGGFDDGSDAFLDTAAIMQNLDLVITSDTAIAHLAGALGRPVWVALKHTPDWRWMLGGRTSPWYPSMRLFRQPARGDWSGAFADIAQDLRADLASRSNS